MKPKDKHEFLRLYDVHKNYKVISEVGSGTYGRVYKAISAKNNKFVALKKIDMSRQELDGFPITAIREIKLLRMLNHKNIIALIEIIMSRPSTSNKFRGSTYLVFEYMDHDFVGLMTIKYRFKLSEIKCIMRQMLEGLKYLHSSKIIHRDMKSANILLNNNGEVKIADFGLARQISPGPNAYYTNKVVTLWYRAPELLLGSTDYNTQIDIWSLGCIFAELLTGEILFKGDKEARQLEIIYEICGSPDKNGWMEVEKLEYFNSLGPKSSYERKLREFMKTKREDLETETLDFLDSLLILDPKKRLTAETALSHPFFKTEPLECSLKEMPRIDKECHETLLRSKKFRKDEMGNKLNENNEKIILLQNESINSPLDHEANAKANTFNEFPHIKEKGFSKNFEERTYHNAGPAKPFYHNNRGGYNGGNMRGGGHYYKRGFHEGYSKHFNNNFGGNQNNPNHFSSVPREGYIQRKFSGGVNNEMNTLNNPISAELKNPLIHEQSAHTNELPNDNTAELGGESIFKLHEKKQEEMELIHLPTGGLRSLIQTQVTLTVGGLKDEEKESLKFEEELNKTSVEERISKKLEVFTEKVENAPSMIAQPQSQVPNFDKTILNERRIKRKDPNAANNNQNPSEKTVKKLHLE